MSVIRTVLPLPKNIIHCLLHRAGYSHSSSGTVSATLLIHKKKCFKNIFTDINLQKAIMTDISYILCFMSNKIFVVL